MHDVASNRAVHNVVFVGVRATGDLAKRSLTLNGFPCFVVSSNSHVRTFACALACLFISKVTPYGPMLRVDATSVSPRPPRIGPHGAAEWQQTRSCWTLVKHHVRFQPLGP